MKKNIITIFIILLFSCPLNANQEQEQKAESLYQQLARAIIRLENYKGRPVGTAFFATYDGDSKHYYLITARHVVFPPKYLRARVPSQRLDTNETEVVELRVPSDQWVLPLENNRKIELNGKVEELLPVDVAVAKIPGVKNRRVRTIGYCSGKCSSDDSKNQFLKTDPEPPLIVMVWGFPVDLGFTLEEQRPMGRLGLVAMKAEEPFIRTEGMLRDHKVFLLDAPIFPGNSGGPVFTYPVFGKIKLAGLVSASSIPLNFAIAEPVSRIGEMMDMAFKSDQQVTATWHLIDKDKANSAGAKSQAAD